MMAKTQSLERVRFLPLRVGNTHSCTTYLDGSEKRRLVGNQKSEWVLVGSF